MGFLDIFKKNSKSANDAEMGEKINLKNMQATPVAQFQKNK